MKKLFLAICFSLLWNAHASLAKVTEIFDQSQLPKAELPKPSPMKVHAITEEELTDFLDERLKKTVIQPRDEVKTKASDVQPSDTVLQAQKEAQKGIFQKIYDNALKRLDGQQSQLQRNDLAAPQIFDTSKQQQKQWDMPNIPTIRTNLPPDGKNTVVPALEHIPYLMTNIEILPDGVTKFTDTIVVVANGKKLRNGLTKILPKDIVSRDNKRHPINYTLINVSVNEQAVPYKLLENGNSVYLIPRENYTLEPGVYTYKFEYLADNLLWNYGDFQEFYWDVTGSFWNLVIARAGATLSLPMGKKPLGQEILIGHPQNLSSQEVVLINPSPDTWGYAVQRPLFIGEGLHLVVSLPEDVVLPPTWDKRLLNTFEKNADVYVSLLTFVAIALSFIISWKYIRANKGQLKVALKKTPVMLRYLAFNRYDLKSFGGFLLDLYRKNIIDIQQADDTLLLIKRTDDLKSLNKSEQKAIHYLFTQDEPVFNVSKNSALKIKRAAKEIEKDLRQSLFKFLTKLNSGYLFFSLSMLFLGELFISLFAINIAQTFGVLLISTLISISGIIIFSQDPQKLWLQILLKALGCLFILFSVLIMAAVVSLWCILFVYLSLLTIKYYTAAYAQRNGLLKSHIAEIEQLRNRLIRHHDNIVLGREIANQQPSIWALDMEKDFISEPLSEFNKLPALLTFMKKFSA